MRHTNTGAFAGARRSGVRASADRNLQLLLRTGTQVATVVGKTWDMHVREALRIPLNENLEILNDTIALLKKNFDEAIFDAEHFFDGYFHNPEFALACLKAVDDAGVNLIALCDTNGGRLPHEIAAGVRAARAAGKCPIGIHCHNDSEVAGPQTLAAAEGGPEPKPASTTSLRAGRRPPRLCAPHRPRLPNTP